MKEFMMKHPIATMLIAHNAISGIVTVIGLISHQPGDETTWESGLDYFVRRNAKKVKAIINDVQEPEQKQETTE